MRGLKLLSKGIMLILLLQVSQLNAQEDSSDDIGERFFMPSFQMGYINHNANNVSGGVIAQTSVEYRAKEKWLFRINYDDFSGRVNVTTSNNHRYQAKTPISELLGGLGYRFTIKEHNLFTVLQPGIRFYESPNIEVENNQITINQEGRSIATMRYTLGYEYEVFKSVFLNVECFVGHFFYKRDFWRNSGPHYGITVGLATRLF